MSFMQAYKWRLFNFEMSISSLALDWKYEIDKFKDYFSID